MFTKIDKIKLDNYFNELAKIYKKKSHGYNFEFILVGGASILVNYDFRDVTNDIDAYYLPSADIKDAIEIVSQKFDIDSKWINNDFQKTKSYSNKLSEFSTFYKSYGEIINVRTIKDEYLIAMKLMSGRKYKNDISDIVGIINSCKSNNKIITYDLIDNAVKNLYGNWDNIDKEVVELLHIILNTKNLNELYDKTLKDENNSKQQLLDFNDKYQHTLNEANINDVLAILNKTNQKYNK
jgi:hypothetical protein